VGVGVGEQKQGSLSRMPKKRLEDRAEAFAKATNRKGMPMTYGAGKEPNKPPPKERERAKK